MICITDITKFLAGNVHVRAKCCNYGSFLTACTHKKIDIKNICTDDNGDLVFDIAPSQFFMLKSVCKKTDSRVRIISKRGFPFSFSKFISRKGLVVGVFSFIFLTVFLCSHVWYIEIDGEGEISHELLRTRLEECGICYGASIKKINPDTVQKQMLAMSPELSWIWPEKKGTKIIVDYRTAVPIPEITDTSRPCNIIASETGTITYPIVHEGKSNLEKGMYVTKGQLLVSGIFDSKMVGYRSVHSDAVIMADVEKRISQQYPLTVQKQVRSGGIKKSPGIVFGKKEFVIPPPGKKFENFEEEKQKFTLHIGNLYFPVSIVKNTYYETNLQTISYEKSKIIEEAKEYLKKDLQNGLKNGIIKEVHFTVRDVSTDMVEVVLDAKCNTDIAQKIPIEEETDGKDNAGS